MIAKYSGTCKVTGQVIVAGVTEIEKGPRGWQVKTSKTSAIKPDGAVVALAWSEALQDRWGDEYLAHFASFGDEDAEPVGKIWRCDSIDGAISLAEQLYCSHNLEDIINDTMW